MRRSLKGLSLMTESTKVDPRSREVPRKARSASFGNAVIGHFFGIILGCQISSSCLHSLQNRDQSAAAHTFQVMRSLKVLAIRVRWIVSASMFRKAFSFFSDFFAFLSCPRVIESW